MSESFNGESVIMIIAERDNLRTKNAELIKELKSAEYAFNDRTKAMGMQLKDKEKLQTEVESVRTTLKVEHELVMEDMEVIEKLKAEVERLKITVQKRTGAFENAKASRTRHKEASELKNKALKTARDALEEISNLECGGTEVGCAGCINNATTKAKQTLSQIKAALPTGKGEDE